MMTTTAIEIPSSPQVKGTTATGPNPDKYESGGLAATAGLATNNSMKVAQQGKRFRAYAGVEEV